MTDNTSQFSPVSVDFAGIGAPKCATTWLYQCLAAHPDICMAHPKGSSCLKEPERCEEFFTHCGGDETVTGEYLPALVLEGQEFAEQIYSAYPDLKLFVSLRDPVERAVSAYLHASTTGARDISSFVELLEGEQPDRIVDVGLYAKHLRPFFETFPREQIYIILYDDIRSDPVTAIGDLYDFLGVDSSFVPEAAKQRVAPTRFKQTRLGKLFHRGVGRPLGKMHAGKRLKNTPVLKSAFYRFANAYAGDNRGTAADVLDENALRQLQNIYEPDIAELEKITGIDLARWRTNYG